VKPILNAADAEATTVEHGEVFWARITPLAERLGATQIGANVTAVPPGKAAYPFHHHHGNEEHFFVLGGNGVLRFGTETYEIRAGDYVFTPPGGPEVAHQFVNTGKEDLIYLSISTRRLPEVVGYPDSGKTGVRTAPDREVGRFLIEDEHKDRKSYWDGEDGAEVRRLVHGP
jgi:uncharacterized cupin superfamily protein